MRARFCSFRSCSAEWIEHLNSVGQFFWIHRPKDPPRSVRYRTQVQNQTAPDGPQALYRPVRLLTRVFQLTDISAATVSPSTGGCDHSHLGRSCDKRGKVGDKWPNYQKIRQDSGRSSPNLSENCSRQQRDTRGRYFFERSLGPGSQGRGIVRLFRTRARVSRRAVSQ
jgi:hypothetical protein